ncbi:MAG: MFS transporter [Candidatus Melainabacteria bacterium]|nr:MFS transporter [Candidatus Melainabacteria bacterium]
MPVQPLPQSPSVIHSSALPPEARGYRAVLQNRSFITLWLGQIFSQVADRIVFVVFVSLIVFHYGVSDRYTSFLYIAFTIPAILLTAIAGVYVDRWPRRAVLVSTNVARGVLVALTPWAAEGHLWALYLLAFLLSAATQFFVPAEAATIPAIVPKHQLTSANSLFTTTMMASVIFGFALGDPLINVFSLKQVHWAIVGLFFLSALMLSRLVVPPRLRLTTEDVSGYGETHQQMAAPPNVRQSLRALLEDLKDGISYIQQNGLIWRAIWKLSLLFSAVVAMCILFVSFAKAYLYADAAVAARKFAYIIAVSGVGMALGAVLVSKPLHAVPRGFLVYGGYLLLGLSLAFLCLVEQVSPRVEGLLFGFPAMHVGPMFLESFSFTVRMGYTYGLSFLMGLSAAAVAIPLQVTLHELIPEDKRGKVLGVQFTMLSTCSTLPVLVAGLGAEFLGVKLMLLAMAMPFLLLGSVGLYQRWRQASDAKTSDIHPAQW